MDGMAESNDVDAVLVSSIAALAGGPASPCYFSIPPLVSPQGHSHMIYTVVSRWLVEVGCDGNSYRRHQILKCV